MHRSSWFFAHTWSSLLSAGNPFGDTVDQAQFTQDPSYTHPITPPNQSRHSCEPTALEGLQLVKFDEKVDVRPPLFECPETTQSGHYDDV